MPSQYESAGLVFLECLALERPVVASHLPALREHAGVEAGVFAPPGDARAIAAATLDLLENPGARAWLARRGARHARDPFDFRRHVDQLTAAFHRVAQSSPQTSRPTAA